MKGDCGTYRGDPVRLRQIMYNLISNALKFTDAGEVRVALSWQEDVLSLIVADTGVGIAPEAVGRLFNNFAQADASTTRRFGGTGLGLAICRHLAEAMNGSISVDSQVGQGSRFSVSLPLERLNGEPVIAVRTTAPADPSDAFERPIRVLAAEDNSVNQLVLKTLLHQAGIQPVMVDNGAAAVEAWEREDWDVILMDIQMPQMDGPTATRRIRELERQRGGRRTPILALTANAMVRSSRAISRRGNGWTRRQAHRYQQPLCFAGACARGNIRRPAARRGRLDARDLLWCLTDARGRRASRPLPNSGWALRDELRRMTQRRRLMTEPREARTVMSPALISSAVPFALLQTKRRAVIRRRAPASLPIDRR